MEMLFNILIAVLMLCMAFCVYMMVRNDKVYGFRMRVLSRSRLHDGKLYPYDQLPDYETMMRRFWVWPLEKFFED